jgi:hypothetical protein
VLDGLRWIRVHKDPTLAFRYSCINANACKECMMEIDGETVYACTTRLEPRAMTVEPLGNKKLVRDLVTEIAPPQERFRLKWRVGTTSAPCGAPSRRGTYHREPRPGWVGPHDGDLSGAERVARMRHTCKAPTPRRCV